MEIYIKRNRSNNKNECFNLQFDDSIEFISIMVLTITMQILIYKFDKNKIYKRSLMKR